MSRHVLTVDLKDRDAVATYTDHHRRVWPEVLRSLRDAGIVDMEIYLLERRLVMLVETDGRDVRECFALHHGSHPRVIEWESLMQSLQVPPPGAPTGQTWSEMTPVFRLGAADGRAAAGTAHRR